jgi:hypothetical protein
MERLFQAYLKKIRLKLPAVPLWRDRESSILKVGILSYSLAHPAAHEGS